MQRWFTFMTHLVKATIVAHTHTSSVLSWSYSDDKLAYRKFGLVTVADASVEYYSTE
ncbi:MAG TPA: hypothetical protein VKP30_31125 [Polyangiaceae bacterium]|nr:hypothetical protein [Polyangiaceae bacterium]